MKQFVYFCILLEKASLPAGLRSPLMRKSTSHRVSFSFLFYIISSSYWFNKWSQVLIFHLKAWSPTLLSVSLLRSGYPEAGVGSGGHPVDRHLSVAGQCHREGSCRLLQWLLVRSWAGVCRAAALDHPGQWRQPGQADQRLAPTAAHWRGGEDSLCHGGQPTGRQDGCARKNYAFTLFTVWLPCLFGRVARKQLWPFLSSHLQLCQHQWHML